MGRASRLFIGIPIPERISRMLYQCDPEIKGLRWLFPSVHHITLCFIGETEMDPEGEVLPVLHHHASQTPPFSLSFEGLVLAPRKQPYMVWARFHSHPLFQRLHDGLFKNFIPQKAPPPQARPHITLARAKRGKKLHKEELPPDPELEELRVEEAVLWSSELKPDGARYHGLGKAELQG
ncbi:MAG: RNA 2',3'-cyclic phosphodiesterase [Flavobacteriales bacterium]